MIALAQSVWTEQRANPLLHERLVRKVVCKYLGRGLDREDLKQEGMLGLVRACRKFDPDRNVRFSTYAMYWISQSMKRAVQNQTHPVRIPMHLQETLAAIYLETIDRSELPARQRERVEWAERTKAAGRAAPGVLDELAAEGDEFDEDGPVARARQLLAAMSPKEREVVAAYHGIGRPGPMTMAEMAVELGMTHKGVQATYSRAIKRIRERFGIRVKAVGARDAPVTGRHS